VFIFHLLFPIFLSDLASEKELKLRNKEGIFICFIYMSVSLCLFIPSFRCKQINQHKTNKHR
jgi:hypothetical protein